jgi:hypothetical protein
VFHFTDFFTSIILYSHISERWASDNALETHAAVKAHVIITVTMLKDWIVYQHQQTTSNCYSAQFYTYHDFAQWEHEEKTEQ